MTRTRLAAWTLHQLSSCQMLNRDQCRTVTSIDAELSHQTATERVTRRAREADLRALSPRLIDQSSLVSVCLTLQICVTAPPPPARVLAGVPSDPSTITPPPPPHQTPPPMVTSCPQRTPGEKTICPPPSHFSSTGQARTCTRATVNTALVHGPSHVLGSVPRGLHC